MSRSGNLSYWFKTNEQKKKRNAASTHNTANSIPDIGIPETKTGKYSHIHKAKQNCTRGKTKFVSKSYRRRVVVGGRRTRLRIGEVGVGLAVRCSSGDFKGFTMSVLTEDWRVWCDEDEGFKGWRDYDGGWIQEEEQ